MIELFFGPTPNCWKASIMLEECGLPYRITPVFLNRGDQYDPAFLKISPNNRIPAIIDHEPKADTGPLAVFESGAILLYLAEKTGRFMPRDWVGRYAVVEWLMWQMANLGPVLGHHGHFLLYSEEKIAYAIDRFRGEAKRLYGVLDRQLAETKAFITGGDYTIADMACFPWVMTHKAQKLTLDDYPHVKTWFARVRARELVQKGLAVGRDLYANLQHQEGSLREKVFGIGAGWDDEMRRLFPDHDKSK